jgi:uncharacterized membrane protein
MNPFDLQQALLAKHAQHVVVIHFPIALVIASVAFDALALWRKRPALSIAARCNLTAAVLSFPVAILTGLLAWHWQLDGAKLQGNLLLHLVFALASAAAVTLWWWHRIRSRALRPSKWHIAAGFVLVTLIAITGHLGGIVSGVEMPE